MQSQHFIDGQWTATDRWTDSLDPANGELIGCFADGGEAEAEAAVAAAARAFNDPQWAQNPRLRQQLLLEWAAGLTARQEQLAQLLTRENGKALAQSRGEIGGAVSEIL
ncbi:aldehyde dehydrogenase family protein, partial [Pseudomonas sp.]|uniref:aldehyde dehydrogenase family protein n=1 Tax=Pseudomonas sp. TaxID=306 RepID=UPI00289B6200